MSRVLKVSKTVRPFWRINCINETCQRKLHPVSIRLYLVNGCIIQQHQTTTLNAKADLSYIGPKGFLSKLLVVLKLEPTQTMIQNIFIKCKRHIASHALCFICYKYKLFIRLCCYSVFNIISKTPNRQTQVYKICKVRPNTD